AELQRGGVNEGLRRPLSWHPQVLGGAFPVCSCESAPAHRARPPALVHRHQDDRQLHHGGRPLFPSPPTKISPAGAGGRQRQWGAVTDGVEREGGLGAGVEGSVEGGDGTGVVGGAADVVGTDLGNRLKGTPAEDLPQTTTSTTTTTTLRPPPWLITNTTKNTTTSTTTSSTTSTTTSTAKPSSSTTSTTARPNTNLEAPAVPSEGGSEGGRDDHEHRDAAKGAATDGPDASDADRVSTSTISTTTVWAPRAEVPPRRSACPSARPRGARRPPAAGCSGTGLRAARWPCSRARGGASGWRAAPVTRWAGGPADLSECRSVWLTTLTARAHTNDAVLAVAHDLATVTGSRALYGGDVTATARLLNSLARRMADDVSNFPDRDQREALVTELVGAAIATGSHLMGGQRDAWADLRPPEHRAAATALLLGLEEAAFLLADNLHHEKTVNHAESNILLRLQVVETRNVAAVTFPSPGETWLQPPPTRPSDLSDAPTGHPSTTSGELDAPAVATSLLGGSSSSSSSSSFDPTNSLQDPETPPPAPQDTITLPPEALLENSENGLVKMVFFSYDGLHHLLQPDGRSYRINEANFKGVNETRVLNSRVVSASLGAGRHIELPEPVVLTFTMIRTVNVTNPACVFWDYTTSSWSEEGCRVLRYNTSHTVCQCDHLTNFAVLMDVHATPLAYPHHLALSIITYVGCVISIVCLLLATIVFHAFRGLKSDRTTIHKNLCVCLLIAETVFLAGVNQTDKPVVCGVVAGLLHFFFLAAFAWMFMEGFQLYVMLVEVFEAEKSRVRWYYGAAYGFPAVVVAVSAVIDPFSYGTKDACWLRADNYFIFAFVGPVIAVIIANSIFLTMSLFIMCRHANLSASVKNKEHTKLASVRSWVRGAVVLMFLLGLTWTFGLLYLNQASVVMAYVFTVLNSLQGLFIFIFHCVQNDKLVPRLTSGRWTRGGSKNSTTTSSSQAGGGMPHLPAGASGTAAGGAGMGMGAGPARAGSLSRASLSRGSLGRGSLSRASLSRTPQRNSSSRSARLHHHNLHTRTAALDHEDEKYSFKSCGRDSGHGGSEQEDSPRAGPAAKLAALRLNNNVAPHLPPDHLEIEREGRSELQVSDLSDEDGRRHSSDISRQSSRSYGDHRPLLPYTLPDRHSGPHHHQPPLPQYDPRLKARPRHPDGLDDSHTLPGGRLGPHMGGHMDHTVVSPGHILPMSHPAVTSAHALPPGNGHISGHHPAVLSALGQALPVVHPLSEPNLRNWEAAQRHRDLQQLQQLGEMTVAVLSGEQVVCKLKPPLAPIHENAGATTQVERHPQPPTYSHC
ncbi:putative latrophilin Cirl-like isoform X4, partial [Penaeus vannamei]